MSNEYKANGTAASCPLLGSRKLLSSVGLCTAITHRHILKAKMQRGSTPGKLESNIDLRGINFESGEDGILEDHRFSLLDCWLAQFALARKGIKTRSEEHTS